MKKIGKLLIGTVIVMMCLVVSSCGSTEKASTTGSPTAALGNGVDDLDLTFLKMENTEENKIYSPLSIKYALAILREGAKGETAKQIENVIGTFEPDRYESNDNMSFANALFIKNSYGVNASYIDTLKEKYDADVVGDSFENPDKINNYISEKTLGLINGFYNDVSQYDFILTNTLAIDMEWINKIQLGMYYYCPHETYSHYISELQTWSREYNYFEGKLVPVLLFGASFNKYDIVKDLGENHIKNIVKEAYAEYKKNGGWDEIDNMDQYLDSYINSIRGNYNTYDMNTDFSYYVDDSVKVVAKDLKEYGGRTLEYVAIMPEKESLKTYIEKLDSKEANRLISSLVSPSIDNVEDGVVTKFEGELPPFKYDYKLNLMDDLKALGIEDVFEKEKADLSQISDGAYIASAGHKAAIEFSNDGIKAAAITDLGGLGADGGFDYWFDVPVKVIDLKFIKPFVYLIRDKESGTVFFTGTVYNPSNESVSAMGKVKVKVKKLNIRTSPSTSADTVGQLVEGDVVEYYMNEFNDGYVWYNIGENKWVATDGTYLEYVY